MADPVRQFEIVIMRPFQVLILGAATATVFRGQWLWLVGCVLALFYLGIVGSKLHPLQSASALAQGPLDGPAALVESAVLTVDDKRWLVGQACTRVGILVGVALFIVLLGALGWQWYWAASAASAVMIISGAVLKVIFGTVVGGAP